MTPCLLLQTSISHGHWILLQNCHLSLQFCEEIMQTVVDTEEVNQGGWWQFKTLQNRPEILAREWSRNMSLEMALKRAQELDRVV